MHVTFITAGSQGDVQPMLALAKGLQAVGFEVRFCAHKYFESFIEQSHVPFFALSGNSPDKVQQDEHSRKRKSRVATLFHVLRRQTKPDPTELNRLYQACQSTDAVIFSPLAGTAYHVVESLGLPCCVVWLHPQYPSRFAPSLVGLPPLPLGQAYNLMTHLLMHVLFWLPSRSWVNRWRKQTLGLGPISVLGPLWNMHLRRVPMLFGFSPALVSRPNDWPEWMHVTGYWFLERAENWVPPSGLTEFLDAGPPPLSIGFGSVVDSSADVLIQSIVEALSVTGQRAVLISGWNRYRSLLPDNVFLVKSVPYDWLFRRVTAAIHAAGAGTVAEALRAGIPSICIPFAGEQKFYARRLATLGIAPPPIPRQDANTDRLIQAITVVTNDSAMRARAKYFESVIGREDGVGEAVRLLKSYLPETSSRFPEGVTS
jgi:sterol 3beta-glucosyltransferase